MSFERASVTAHAHARARACALDVRDRPPRLVPAPQCLTVALAHCSGQPQHAARRLSPLVPAHCRRERFALPSVRVMLRRRATQHSTRVAPLCSRLQQRAGQRRPLTPPVVARGPRSVDVVDFADMLAVLPFCALSQLEIGPSPPAPMRTQRRPPRVLTGYRLSLSGTGTTGSVQSRRRCGKAVLPTGTASQSGSLTRLAHRSSRTSPTTRRRMRTRPTTSSATERDHGLASVPLSRYSVPSSR
jgi:hypothetical protein